jgi:hypothetical protein
VNATLGVYLHDSSSTGDWENCSFEVLHESVGYLLDSETPFFWILLNKQDKLPVEKRKDIVKGLRQRFEKEMEQYKEKLRYRILDFDGLSGLTGDGLYEVLDDMHTTMMRLKNSKKQVTDSITGSGKNEKVKEDSKAALTGHKEALPTNDELIKRIEEEAVGEVDADTFWNQFLTGELPVWNHRSHLRAGYFILLDALSAGDSIFEAAEKFLSELSRLNRNNPERFRNTTHR